MTVYDALEIATAHHRAGRLAEAEAVYQRILSEHPDVPQALNLLGVLEHQRGRNDESVGLLARAIDLAPMVAEFHLHIGLALSAQGKLESAVGACRRALAINPRLAEAHHNLGLWLAASQLPEEALAASRQAIALRPHYAEAHCNIGNILAAKNLLDEASAAYAEAIRHRPDYAEAHYNLANMLAKRGKTPAAIPSFRTAIGLRPDYVDAHFNLANTLHSCGEIDAAAESYVAALRHQPQHAGALWNLGNVWKDRGQIRKAIGLWRDAHAIERDDAALHSTLVLYFRYDPDTSLAGINAEEARWNQRQSVPLRPHRFPHRPSADPGKRLRIGYVSPDFWNHAVGRNVLPLLSARDRENFEVFCYSDAKRPDALTERLRSFADHWCDSTRLSDAQLADKIHCDQVDILVDLALHTGGNRLPVFARQPAPVQFSFAGYPGGTGVETIAHRISDPYLEGDSPRSPTTHLIESFWCFDPVELEIPVNPLPALSQQSVTFACLNQPCKINEAVFALWARVLRDCAGSRLLLLSPLGSHRALVLETFRTHGIDAERIEFVPPDTRAAYMRRYHRVDVMLDSFPYGGHTTGLEALWMGVPVVTLPGVSIVSRAGLSQLRNLGMPDLIARDEDDYVRIATALARDLPRLAEIRTTLRGRMEKSVLMDATRFARGVEGAYRAAWRSWCDSPGA